jgi:subtilisin family serine protease
MFTQVINSVKSADSAASNVASSSSWGLLNTASKGQLFTAPNQTLTSMVYSATNESLGLGVDMVFLEGDQHAIDGHPEWLDPVTGENRFKQVDWAAVSGVSGLSQPADFYTNTPGNHGTGTMSAAGGRLYGFAKRAHLYALGSAIGTVDKQVEVVIGFHKNKTDKTRPTVMCFNSTKGYYLDTRTELEFRGITLNGVAKVERKTLTTAGQDISTEWGLGGYTPNSQTATIKTGSTTGLPNLFKQATEAGIIVTTAAGNDARYIASPDDPIFFNALSVLPFAAFFTNRHFSSTAEDVITVGAYTPTTTDSEYNYASFSAYGSHLDIVAPGVGCLVAGIPSSSGDGVFNYPLNSSHKVITFSGTSLANPLTAGYCACLAGKFPELSPKQIKSVVVGTGKYDVETKSNIRVPRLKNIFAEVKDSQLVVL